MKKFVPNEEQLNALKRWKKENGRTWKNELNHAWMTGNYNRFEGSNLLQQIRNSGGPSWLHRFKLNDEN